MKLLSRLSVITDKSAADVLTNPQTLRQLEPFLGRSLTVTEAAKETGEKANTVLSRVRRFVKLGLLEVAEDIKRKGRSIKKYRTTADVFFVPYEATSAETLEVAMAERDAYWEELLRKSVVKARVEDVGSWGTRIYRDERGRLQIQAAITPDKNYTMLDKKRPAVLSAWRDSVYLDFEDAKTLQREMFELLKKYQQKEGGQQYIVRLGVAPI
ncbi:MAG: hypothetical protein ACRCYY_04130 [Trueperaceae bacterium]